MISVESWERQIRIPIIVNNQPVCIYVADFLVTYADGRKELVEIKGFATPEYKLKKRLLEATFLQDHAENNFRELR